MVEISESTLLAVLAIAGFFTTFVYFFITRRDKKTVDAKGEIRDTDSEERDKQELARKVKKEMTDEAEKVEQLRKSVAELTKTENQAYTNQKVGEAITAMKHEFELYKVTIESKFALHGQATESKFKALDTTMETLLTKMVDIAKISSDSMVKINETVEALRELLSQLSDKVIKQERNMNNKVDK